MGILSKLFESGESKRKRLEEKRIAEETEAKRREEITTLTKIRNAIWEQGDSSTSRQAVEFLKNQAPGDVLPIIREMLSSPRENYYGKQIYHTRWRGLGCLGFLGRNLGWKEAVELLKPFISDPERNVQYFAVQSLANISYNKDLLPLVREAAIELFEHLFRYFVEEPDLNISGSLKGLITLTGDKCIQPLLTVLPSFTDKHQKYQHEYAIEILEELNASPTLQKPAIIEGLASSDVEIRKKACYNSVNVADQDVVNALIKVMQEFPEPQYNSKKDVYQCTRKGAAFALGRIGDHAAIQVLLEALKDDSPWGVTTGGKLVKMKTGMDAFGTSARGGLEEANTEFAKMILSQS